MSGIDIPSTPSLPNFCSRFGRSSVLHAPAAGGRQEGGSSVTYVILYICPRSRQETSPRLPGLEGSPPPFGHREGPPVRPDLGVRSPLAPSQGRQQKLVHQLKLLHEGEKHEDRREFPDKDFPPRPGSRGLVVRVVFRDPNPSPVLTGVKCILL